MRAHFRRDSSCTSRPCCRNPHTPARCTGSRRCETSGTWTLPWIRSTVCTAGWTRSRQSRPLCTCFLKEERRRGVSHTRSKFGSSKQAPFCSSGLLTLGVPHFYNRAKMNLMQLNAAICFLGLTMLTARLALIASGCLQQKASA